MQFTLDELNKKAKEKPFGYKKLVLKLALTKDNINYFLSYDDWKLLKDKFGNKTSFRYKLVLFFKSLKDNYYLLINRKKIFDSEKRTQIKMDICQKCSELNKFNVCKVCGCNMKVKTKLIAAKCPLNKW